MTSVRDEPELKEQEFPPVTSALKTFFHQVSTCICWKWSCMDKWIIFNHVNNRAVWWAHCLCNSFILYTDYSCSVVLIGSVSEVEHTLCFCLLYAFIFVKQVCGTMNLFQHIQLKINIAIYFHLQVSFMLHRYELLWQKNCPCSVETAEWWNACEMDHLRQAW